MTTRSLAAVALAALAVPAAGLASQAAMHPELGAKLTGAHEVPPAARGGQGIVNLTLDAPKGTVCWTFQGIAGIGKPTAAHVHRAPISRSGPIVVPLGGAFRTKGCTHAARSTIDAIETSPGSYYVNVHTPRFPNGAIRGQLVAGMVHM